MQCYKTNCTKNMSNGTKYLVVNNNVKNKFKIETFTLKVDK